MLSVHVVFGVLDSLCSVSQTRSALRAAKHTHRHRSPPLVGPNVYLDFKGMGPTVM